MAIRRLLLAWLMFLISACAVGPGPGSITPEVEVNPTTPVNPFLRSTNTPTVLSNVTVTQEPTEATTPTLSVVTPVPLPTMRLNTPLAPGLVIKITALQMVDQLNGWGFDNGQHILLTHDGGLTWRDVTPPEGRFTPAGFFALDAKTAWATFFIGLYSLPTTAPIWRTSDGGETWTSTTIRLDRDALGEYVSTDHYFPIQIQFVDAQTGWLMADISNGMNSMRALLYRTTDGGQTWVVINDHYHDLGGCVNVGFAFSDSQTGWIGSNCFRQGIVSNQIGYFILPNGWQIKRSLDGGSSFGESTSMPLPVDLQKQDILDHPGNCGELRFVSIAVEVVGIEWGCNIFARLAPDYHYFALTADGGHTWTAWPSAGNEFFLDAKQGWRLWRAGQLQQTNDGGLNWGTIKAVTWENAQINFIDALTGWAVVARGQESALVHTADGGKTWDEIKPVSAP